MNTTRRRTARMKITCPAVGYPVTVQNEDEVWLKPDHPRFVEEEPTDELTAEFDFPEGESAQFEVHDFEANQTPYEVSVDRVAVRPNGSTTVLESWARNGTKVVSGEYHTQQVLDLQITARDTSSSSGNTLKTSCKIHVRPIGLPGDITG